MDRDVPLLRSPVVIVCLVASERMEVEEGLGAMSRIREYVRASAYEAAVEEIEVFAEVVKGVSENPREGEEER